MPPKTQSAWVPPAAGLKQRARLLRACADLVPENTETNHAVGLHAVLSRLKRRSLVVVFTDFTDATMAELMIEYLQQLVRKHVVIFVALDDPAMETPWDVSPDSPESMAKALITSELSDARKVVFRTLALSGVRVVHGPPGQASLLLLQQYLKIKRRGLLG